CCGSCSCGLLALLGCGTPRPNLDGRMSPGNPPSCPEETAQIGHPSGPLGLGAKGVDHVRLPSLGGPASLAGVRLCPRLEGPPALLARETAHARQAGPHRAGEVNVRGSLMSWPRRRAWIASRGMKTRRPLWTVAI